MARENTTPTREIYFSMLHTYYTQEEQGTLIDHKGHWPSKPAGDLTRVVHLSEQTWREEGKGSITERNSRHDNSLATQIIRSCYSTVTTDLMKSSRHCSWWKWLNLPSRQSVSGSNPGFSETGENHMCTHLRANKVTIDAHFLASSPSSVLLKFTNPDLQNQSS